jgi:environmental stress-induced protein Ves
MILDGALELIHEGRYTKHLKPFDQDTFSGEWSTRSKGKVTDFNLMLKGGAEGSLTHHAIGPGDKATFSADTGFCFVYIAGGSVAFSDGSRAKAGDLVQLIGENSLRLEGDANLVEIRVMLNQHAGTQD